MLSNIKLAFGFPILSISYKDLKAAVLLTIISITMIKIIHLEKKKYRKGIEYGSARWGKMSDIKPFMDDEWDNNIILTETESLTLSGRPKDPRYARNKNILVIGGSGSGKTRFFVTPNLMQMHKKTSYVITDPKGTVILNVGNMLKRHGYRITNF
jgi:Type IV secretory pathway, VirD4 components